MLRWKQTFSGLKTFDRALQYLRIKPRQNELDKENKTIE